MNEGYQTQIIEPDNLLEVYYHGNVLYSDKSELISGSCVNLTKDDKIEHRNKQNKMVERFAALTHKLLPDYSMLTRAETDTSVYFNLVRPFTLTSPDKKLEFVDKDLNVAAIVVDEDDFELKEDTAKVGDVPVCLVICNGSVTIKTSSFKGLILAGKNIYLDSPNCSIQADSTAVVQALGIKGANGKCPADYLYDGYRYLPSGAGGTSNPSEGKIDFTDCVTYKNWNKQ